MVHRRSALVSSGSALRDLTNPPGQPVRQSGIDHGTSDVASRTTVTDTANPATPITRAVPP